MTERPTPTTDAKATPGNPGTRHRHGPRDYSPRVGLFSRRRSPQDVHRAQAGAIDDFWRWWRDEGAARTARVITGDEPESAFDALTRHVHAIHPDLAWELSKGGADGSGSDHAHTLVVTSEGNPELRAVARRWRRAAPEPDATWDYADVRAATAEDFTLQVAGADLESAQVQVTARVDGPRVHVVVHHPALETLPDDARRNAAFLLLDAVLGEVAVETWVGEISASHLPPLDPVPLSGLTAVVDHLRGQYIDADGNPTWVLLRGERSDGTPLIASTQVPLVAATAPHLDTHVAVTVEYSDRTEQGFPGDGSLDELRSFEDHLAGRLGGSGRLVAHETSGGTRVLHFYVDGATPAAAQVEAATTGWRQGRTTVQAGPDPGWEGVRHLRV